MMPRGWSLHCTAFRVFEPIGAKDHFLGPNHIPENHYYSDAGAMMAAPAFATPSHHKGQGGGLPNGEGRWMPESQTWNDRQLGETDTPEIEINSFSF